MPKTTPKKRKAQQRRAKHATPKKQKRQEPVRQPAWFGKDVLRLIASFLPLRPACALSVCCKHANGWLQDMNTYDPDIIPALKWMASRKIKPVNANIESRLLTDQEMLDYETCRVNWHSLHKLEWTGDWSLLSIRHLPALHILEIMDFYCSQSTLINKFPVLACLPKLEHLALRIPDVVNLEAYEWSNLQHLELPIGSTLPLLPSKVLKHLSTFTDTIEDGRFFAFSIGKNESLDIQLYESHPMLLLPNEMDRTHIQEWRIHPRTTSQFFPLDLVRIKNIDTLTIQTKGNKLIRFTSHNDGKSLYVSGSLDWDHANFNEWDTNYNDGRLSWHPDVGTTMWIEQDHFGSHAIPKMWRDIKKAIFAKCAFHRAQHNFGRQFPKAQFWCSECKWDIVIPFWLK